MKRLPAILITIFFVFIYTIPTFAQPVASISVVRFRDNEPNCVGRSELVVDVNYDGDSTAYVSVETGIDAYRSVTSLARSVAAPTSGTGVVFDGIMRVIVRFGSVAGSSGYDKRVYWFDCTTGMTVSDEMITRDDRRRVPTGFTSEIHVSSNDISQLRLEVPRLHTPPSHGTIVRVGDHFEYTPDAGYVGADRFKYIGCNIAGVCRGGTVDLTVYELVDPHVSSVVVTSTECDSTGNMRVLYYYAGGPAFLTATSGITEIADVSSRNTQDFGYNLINIPISSEGVVVGGNAVMVRLQYGTVANDGTHHDEIYWFDCNTGLPINTLVRASDDIAIALENFPKTFNVTSNDRTNLPFDFDALSIVTAPSNGSVTIGTDGELTYTYGSATDFPGTDSFEYEICNVAGRCDTATVTVAIRDLPDPVITDVLLRNTTCGSTGTFTIDYIYSGGPAVLTIISGTTASYDVSSDDLVDFIPSTLVVTVSSAGVVDSGFAFPITVLYGTSANDDSFDSDTRWFDCTTGAEVTPVITANNDSGDAPENFPLPIMVLDNDESNLSMILSTLTIVSDPSRGSVSIDGDTITYIYGSATDFSGTDSFEYEICNAAGICDNAVVTIAIIDMPPPDIQSLELVEFACEGPGSIDVTVTFSGGPGVITAITGITSSADISSDILTDFGLRTVTLPISSDNGGVQGDNVLIIELRYGTAINDASYDGGFYYFDCITGLPIVPLVDAVDDYIPAIARGLATEVDALVNDKSRLPLDMTTLTVTSDPFVGTLEFVNGVFVYTGDGLTTGEVSFTYEICNSYGFCDTAVVTMNLVNMPPVCEGSSTIFVEVWSPNHSMVPITIEGVYDPDGDPINYVLLSVVIYEEGYSYNADLDDIDFDAENGLIRAERSGNGNGRIYAIEYLALDPDAQFCEGMAYIYVPHDQRNHGCEFPGFDVDGSPFPVAPDDCENSSNGTGNANGGNPGNTNANPSNNGNGNSNPPPVDTTPVPPVDTTPVPPTDAPAEEGDGGNNGLGNDRDNGNAQGDPQRDNNNGNSNGNNNGNTNTESNTDGNGSADVTTPVTETPEANTGNNGNGNGNSGNANGNANGNNGNGNGGNSNNSDTATATPEPDVTPSP